YQIAREGQLIFQKWAALSFPTLAVIEGDCLGAGLEWALACRYRAVVGQRAMRLALPQIHLGLMPGWGGCTRLPGVVGFQRSLDLVLSGEALSPAEALEIGLADVDLPQWDTEKFAVAFLREILENRGKTISRQRRLLATGRGRMDRSVLGRARIIRVLDKKIRRTLDRRYPAPREAMRAIQFAASHPVADALAFEARKFAVLCSAPVTQKLIWQELIRQKYQGDGPEMADSQTPAAPVCVVGAGTWGAQMAILAARNGHPVRLKDLTYPPLAETMAALEQVAREHRDQGIYERLSPTLSMTGFARARLVLEALPEDPDLKGAILRELEKRLKPDTLLVTTSATQTLASLGGFLENPGNLVALRIFRPGSRHGLAEFSIGKAGEPTLVPRLKTLARSWGLIPIQVADVAGGLLNRLLCVYFRQALILGGAGVPIWQIDRELRQFGMARGPFEMMDEWGLRNVLLLLNELGPWTRGAGEIPSLLIDALALGISGKTSNEGFYRYRNGQKGKPNKLLGKVQVTSKPVKDTALISEKVVLSLIDQVVRDLSDGVVDNLDAVDAVTLFGMGFPGFRGGLGQYAEYLGAAKIAGRLLYFGEMEDPRYQPSPQLLKIQEEGRTFREAFDGGASG
ncbi:MAG: enoyl-CoA hydratase/isomerase family protein, partial [Calditrichaeota bacterium]|nr:enoyl-CoA hydratase/isomerase family protein [Calditrichota bacterium]